MIGIDVVNPERLTRPVVIQTQMVVIITIAASLILVLKHPDCIDITRKIQEHFLEMIGRVIVEDGILTAEEWQQYKSGELNVRASGESGPLSGLGKNWN